MPKGAKSYGQVKTKTMLKGKQKNLPAALKKKIVAAAMKKKKKKTA
tara:strand:+ start:48 stop:185 length:138 start_codon:yes stop_codon:yes gene_type:complete